MNAREITRALKGHWHGYYGTACCPSHPDTQPSLSLKDGDGGRLLARCFAGCSFENVLAALRQRGLLEDSIRPASVGEIVHTERETREHDKRKAEAISRIWRECEPANGTLAETYLRSRGLDIEIPPTLRYHPALPHPTCGQWPAMVAAVAVHPGKEVVGIRRTFIARDGRGKADVTPSKMMLGRCAGGAVRLGPVGDCLLVGEGIETCLAVMQVTGRTAWAALSTSGLTCLVLPEATRDIVILADGDNPGEKAAMTAARRWIGEGRAVRIARPPQGQDFLDMLKESDKLARAVAA
jgi:putative DNA primase/helicase